MKFLFFLLLPIFSFAVVIRDDIPDLQYREFAQNEAFEPVGLIQATKKIGTGFLIAPDVVLTAGHNVRQDKTVEFCLYSSQSKTWDVYSGRVRLHPNFVYELGENKKPRFIENDIALVFLDKPVQDIKPVTLYRNTALIGKMITSCGFGRTATGLAGPLERDKQKRAFTNQITGKKQFVGADSYYVCSFEEPKDVDLVTALEGCGAKGDSGAPVFVEEDGKKSVMGILSLVSRESKYHDFNAILPISPYLNWIENNLSDRLSLNG